MKRMAPFVFSVAVGLSVLACGPAAKPAQEAAQTQGSAEATPSATAPPANATQAPPAVPGEMNPRDPQYGTIYLSESGFAGGCFALASGQKKTVKCPAAMEQPAWNLCLNGGTLVKLPEDLTIKDTTVVLVAKGKCVCKHPGDEDNSLAEIVCPAPLP